MDSSTDDEIAHEFHPYFRAYKDGRVERFFGSDKVPASEFGSSDGVCSKDVVISAETAVSARVFVPSDQTIKPALKPHKKLPLLVYFHGGGLFMGSPFCSTYHSYVSSVVSTANVVAVSVDYRLAPENYVPAAYEDCWAALKWVASHSHGGGAGPEPWLNNFADFDRVFLAGDSAGGNIVHNMAVQAGSEGLDGVKLSGICLVHPYFGRKNGGVDKCWVFVCPDTSGFDDPRINPAVVGSRMSSLGLGCTSRVLVCLAEKDNLRERGLFYCESLRESGWGGDLKIVETEGEDHVFHLFKPNSDKSVALMAQLSSFINQDKA
ncbi:hypothetical protein ACOSQ2_005596 [Xanthoceras sorbifolium]|uniref:Alpha/beta hydrolase fold-3 domain-containing protein n=1 Tax=Xanthoceras sorbifolium TaxID=99658 RepID=A0ABQ8IEY1_9ROSI|nr:hypothetical protein JRO89_XS02G0065300 [Xanthoceras sorbifolium]